jgi:hypothetical protein
VPFAIAGLWQRWLGPDIYGIPQGEPTKTTAKTARGWLEQQLESPGNQRLKIDQITAEADGTIVAEIVTVDGSLVQKLTFNRYSGFARQER